MRWGGLFAGLLLTACAREEPVPEVVSFRDRSVPIASQVDVTAARLAGRWVFRSQFSGFPGQTLSFEQGADGGLTFVETATLCEGEICGLSSTRYQMVQRGPGRWQTDAPSGSLPEGELWILWLDFDNRTMAIGTPDGSFGFILDREATGGEDRIAAARDIMEWMGYRVDEMVSP